MLTGRWKKSTQEEADQFATSDRIREIVKPPVDLTQGTEAFHQ